MQEQSGKGTALCRRENIKEVARTGAVIGNICLLRTATAGGQFFSPVTMQQDEGCNGVGTKNVQAAPTPAPCLHCLEA